MELCIACFNSKMDKIYGKSSFWFKILGGVSGSNYIRREVFEKKVKKILGNTCHSSCVGYFMEYVVGDCEEFLWEDIRKRIGLFAMKNTINENNNIDKDNDIEQN